VVGLGLRFAGPNELARTFDVELSADAQGFTGDLEFLDDSGAKVSRHVHGEQCAPWSVAWR